MSKSEVCEPLIRVTVDEFNPYCMVPMLSNQHTRINYEWDQFVMMNSETGEVVFQLSAGDHFELEFLPRENGGGDYHVIYPIRNDERSIEEPIGVKRIRGVFSGYELKDEEVSAMFTLSGFDNIFYKGDILEENTFVPKGNITMQLLPFITDESIENARITIARSTP